MAQERKPKVKPEPALPGPIPGAVGPTVRLGGGREFHLAVLPYGTASAYQEIFTEAMPEQGLFQGTSTGDTLVRALGVSRRFAAMDGILQRFVLDCPAGIAAESSRGELVAALDTIFTFHGYDLTAAIIKNSAALAETVFLRGMAQAVEQATPMVEAELMAELSRLRPPSAPAAPANGESETTAPDGSDTHPDSTGAS